MEKQRLHYYEQLAELYPTIGKASTEIINLQSILYLPKGTEHFLSDIHGEFKAFSHVLRNGSGAVRKKIDDVFGHTLSTADKMSLATLIYYPQKKIELVRQTEDDIENWYKITLYRLIEVCKTVSSKYTRSKVRKALPEDYAYVIEELITEKQEVLNKEAYYEAIINTILELGQADNFIVALAELVQRLVIDHLHILGDVYDRGPSPDRIMDQLEQYHSFDIQWGNHDMVWMGAAAGQLACIASVIRTSIRYGNLDLIEDGYGSLARSAAACEFLSRVQFGVAIVSGSFLLRSRLACLTLSSVLGVLHHLTVALALCGNAAHDGLGYLVEDAKVLLAEIVKIAIETVVAEAVADKRF